MQLQVSCILNYDIRKYLLGMLIALSFNDPIPVDIPFGVGAAKYGGVMEQIES
jgi:hypothetical protein